jgi:hypothetical protein
LHRITLVKRGGLDKVPGGRRLPHFLWETRYRAPDLIYALKPEGSSLGSASVIMSILTKGRHIHGEIITGIARSFNVNHATIAHFCCLRPAGH